MGRRTQIEIATDTLRSLLAHLEALAEMGVPLPIPGELADSCRKIARLAGAPVGEVETDATVPDIPAPSLNSEVSTPRAAPRGTVAGVDTREPAGALRTTVRDAILRVIQPGEDVTAGVVIDRLEAAGITANRDTVSNELSRFTHEGVLERPARGIYRAVIVDCENKSTEPSTTPIRCEANPCTAPVPNMPRHLPGPPSPRRARPRCRTPPTVSS